MACHRRTILINIRPHQIIWIDVTLNQYYPVYIGIDVEVKIPSASARNIAQDNMHQPTETNPPGESPDKRVASLFAGHWS